MDDLLVIILGFLAIVLTFAFAVFVLLFRVAVFVLLIYLIFLGLDYIGLIDLIVEKFK